MGQHHFRYALFPHAYGPQLGGVVPEAAAFNQSLPLIPASAAPHQRSFFSISNATVIIDTVKQAEDSKDIIVRLYESHGGHQKARLITSLPLVKATRVNLLEVADDSGPQLFVDGSLMLRARPFEIISLRLSLA